MKNIILILIIALVIIVPVSAQQSMGTHLMRGTWQANQSNVAMLPKDKFTVALPGFYNYLVSNNVSYNDIKGTVVDGERILDVDQVINQLDENNLIRENLDIETVAFGARLGRFFVSFGHAIKYSNYLNYPKTFPQLVWQGNAQFVGEEVAFGPETRLFSYHEFALGGAVQVTDWLTVGGRFKFLNGMQDISTEKTDLSLYTDDDIYQLRLNADYLINSSGSLQYNSLSDISVNFDFGRVSLEDMITPNKGYAFDLGVHMNFGKFDIAASVLDIGEIEWTRDVNNYSLEGTFEYNGLNPADGLLGDSVSIGSALDSLRDVYDLTETHNQYKTKLPSRYFVSATYQLTKALRLGGVFFTEDFRGETTPAFVVGANYQVLPFLNVGGIYGYKNKKWDNIGLNAAVQLGPVQIIAATDNIITVFDFTNANSADLRVGLNLVFGGRPDTDMNNISDQEEFFR